LVVRLKSKKECKINFLQIFLKNQAGCQFDKTFFILKKPIAVFLRGISYARSKIDMGL